MKDILGLLLIAVMISSCAAIENSVAKWKTPETEGAGVAEGEKSNYFKGDNEAEAKVKSKKPSAKKAKTKALKK